MESDSVCNHTSDYKIGRPQSGSYTKSLGGKYGQLTSHYSTEYRVPNQHLRKQTQGDKLQLIYRDNLQNVKKKRDFKELQIRKKHGSFGEFQLLLKK